MKTLKISFLALAASLLFMACDIHEPDYYYHDTVPPAAPQDVYVINGDNRADITWRFNSEPDIAGYNVYYAYSYDGKYTLLASTSNDYYIDFGATNGTRYYYAIVAYDYNGNESDLSPDVAYATPRPEGYNEAIFDYIHFPDNAGYSFTTYSAVPYDDLETDFYFEYYEGHYYLNVYKDTDIQDAGHTTDILDIPYAPAGGWFPEKYAEVFPGHTYIIWTWDNHFAKVRVSSVTNERVVFDWAFQLVEGERQLKPVKTNTERSMIPVNRTKEKVSAEHM